MTMPRSAARSRLRSITGSQIGCGRRSIDTTPISGGTLVKPSVEASRRPRASIAEPSSTVRSRSRHMRESIQEP
ncbi:hypothetical protein [Nonomuraea sp. GTA35]|uniref:hypothetical protein n=1 Tax=Nonomuraea sp. GTA35 TaxID=1676746 RepID=UPI0035C20B3A